MSNDILELKKDLKRNNSLSLINSEEETNSNASDNSSDSEGYTSDEEDNYTSSPSSTNSSPIIVPKKNKLSEIIEDAEDLPPISIEEDVKDKKIKELEDAVKFHATNENNYLKMLGIVEAKLDSKDLEIKELKKEIAKSRQSALQKEEIFTQGETPSNKLLALLKKNLSKEELEKELGELQKQSARPNQFFISWKNNFGNKSPVEIKESFEKQKKSYLDQIQRLEKLLASKNKKNISVKGNYKKETKLCEICEQIKQDNFKYSRVSSRGFNTYHVYRICSLCQKIVQIVAENKDINTTI